MTQRIRKIFNFNKLTLVAFLCLLSSQSIVAQLNMDNIETIKQLYRDRDWFKADTIFYEQIVEVTDSVLKENLLLDWGIFMVENRDYDWAERPLLWAIELAKYNQNRRTIAEGYYQLGELYYILEIPLQAQQYYLDALELFEAQHDSLGIGRCYDGLADNYGTMGDHDNAMEYYFKADTVFRNINAPDLRSNILGNIGNELLIWGYTDSGLAYINRALAIDREIENISNLVNHTSSLALYYETVDSLEKAYEYYTKAHKLAATSDDPVDLGFTNQYLAFLHYELGDVDSAKIYMERTLDISLETNNLQLKTSASYLLSEIYGKEGDYKKAFEFLKFYSDANDTLFTDQNILGMAYMKSKYAIAKSEADKELLKREAELAEIRLKNQKITNYFLGFASIIFLGAFGWVLYYAQQRKRINQQLREDKETIQQQTKQLREMDQYKSRFFANISHDFRSPLALIMGYVEILKQEDNRLTETSETALHHINESVNRLNDMTDEIRDLVRLQEKRVRLKFVRIQVNAFFGMLSDMFASAARARGLEMDFHSDLGWDSMIHADKYALEKIIFNLIDNALKYNTTGSKVGFYITQTQGKVQIKICDDGPGIAEEKLPLVFERYYQSHEKSHSAIEGQGIGLNVVKEYVELHGGTIAVSSIPDKETCFTFLLPFNLEKPLFEEQTVGNVLDEQLKKVLEKRKISLNYQRDENLEYKKEHHSSDSHQMVLVVDDHPGIREYISKILSDEFLVLEASNGEEGMYILETTSDISLVITDLMMPKMSGQDMIQKMKSSSRLKDIPVLVISANKEMEEQFVQLSQNQLTFISKPFDAEDLLNKIEFLINVNT